MLMLIILKIDSYGCSTLKRLGSARFVVACCNQSLSMHARTDARLSVPLLIHAWPGRSGALCTQCTVTVLGSH